MTISRTPNSRGTVFALVGCISEILKCSPAFVRPLILSIIESFGFLIRFLVRPFVKLTLVNRYRHLLTFWTNRRNLDQSIFLLDFITFKKVLVPIIEKVYSSSLVGFLPR